MIDLNHGRRHRRNSAGRRVIVQLRGDVPAPRPAEPMALEDLVRRLPARHARLLGLLIATGVDQATACEQLTRLVERGGVR